MAISLLLVLQSWAAFAVANADLPPADFASALASADSELSNIVSQEDTTTDHVRDSSAGKLDGSMDKSFSLASEQALVVPAVPLPSRQSDDTQYGATLDVAPEDQMRMRMRMLQSNVQSSVNYQYKLRSAVGDRDQALVNAKTIMRKELKALQSTEAERDKQASLVKTLSAEQESLRVQLARAKQALSVTEKQEQQTQNVGISSKAASAEMRNMLRAADAAASKAKHELASVSQKYKEDNTAADGQIRSLEATVTSMQSQVAGVIAAKVRWQKNATSLMQQLSDAKEQLKTMLTSKTTADVNVAQMITKWKDTLAQLQQQVAVNAELQQRGKSDQEDLTAHLEDLKKQIQFRDARLADLKNRMDQHSQGTGTRTTS